MTVFGRRVLARTDPITGALITAGPGAPERNRMAGRRALARVLRDCRRDGEPELARRVRDWGAWIGWPGKGS